MEHPLPLAAGPTYPDDVPDCPSCRTHNPEAARFCMSCGTALVAECPHCREELPPNARFCASCGGAVGAPPGAATELIKLVTILFADVVGSTAQAETMKPEDTRALMAEFFDAMSAEIRAEGGTIERIIGDAIMADFGVPMAREDDPVRAVRAGRRMLERLETFNAGRPPNTRIQLRIGINTGAVSTGGSFGEQLLVMGDAVNVAARLEQAAEPGTILIGESTARAVRRFFRLRAHQPVAAKGKSQPVPAYAVEDELPSAGVPVLREAPLLGRNRELERLRALFERAVAEAAPVFCTIISEPGVGKTRLVAEFIRSLEDQAKILVGRCPPYGEGLTLAALQEILRSEAQIFPQDESALSWTKLEGYIAGEMPDVTEAELRQTAASLGSTLGLVPAFESLGSLDPRLVHRQMLRAWRDLFTSLAWRHPLVVLIEDLHWADPMMREVVADLCENLRGPVLFLSSGRPEIAAPGSEWLPLLRAHVPIPLEALEQSHSKDLVTELLGAADLPAELIEQVLTRAEGNPLFIEEILLRLIDQGYLTEAGAGWRFTGEVTDLDVPEQVQTLIQARLDRLSPREREVVQAAAVIGRYFWSGAVEWVTGLPNAATFVERLKPRQIVIEQLMSRVPGHTEYAFRHALIRDVAYESLPRKARARSHAATARWIESIRGDRVEEAAEILAEHYERAYNELQEEELRTPARLYMLLAARTALRRFATSQAERFGKRAVELSAAGEEKAAALEALGDAYHLAMRGNLAWNAYTSAMAELDVGTDTADNGYAGIAAKAVTVATRWVGTLDQDVPVDEIERVIERGLLSAGTSDSRERVLLLSARAFLAGTAGSVSEPMLVSAEDAAQEALDLARRLDDSDLLSGAMDATSVRLWPSGRFGEIVRIDRDRLQLLPDLSDVREIADILLSAGRDLTRVGEYREALEYLDQAAEVVRAIDPGQYLHTLVHRSATRCALGMWDEALQDVAEIERLENLEDDDAAPPYAVRAFGVAYFCHQFRGESESAERYLTILRAYVQNVDHLGPDARDPLALPARALARAGHVSEAMSWLSFERWSGLSEHLEAGCDLVLMAMEDEAATVLAKARREVEYAEVQALEYHADRLEAQLLLRSGELTSAIDLFIRSADGFARLQAIWEEAWSRLLATQVLRQRVSTDAADEGLRRALRTFKRLRSTAEANVCETLSVSGSSIV